MFNFGIIKICTVDFYCSFAGKKILAYKKTKKTLML